MIGSTGLGGLLALAVAVTAAAAPAAPSGRPDLDKLAGVYRRSFENVDSDGNRYDSEDILEVVKLSPETAYFRTHMEFPNYHECNLSGVADLETDALVYRDRAPVVESIGPCMLKIRANARGVFFDDVGGGCRLYYCGARGGFEPRDDGVSFRFSRRRAIGYLSLIRKSEEYIEAIKAHEQPGPPSP